MSLFVFTGSVQFAVGIFLLFTGVLTTVFCILLVIFLCFACQTTATGVAYILWSENPIPSKYKTLLTKGDQEIASKEGVDIGCYPQYY